MPKALTAAQVSSMFNVLDEVREQREWRKEEAASKLTELKNRLEPCNWALTGEVYILDARDPESMDLKLKGCVIRAGQREGELGERVDEGELGVVAYIEPGEVYDDALAGMLAISVHIASGSTRVWPYRTATPLELPHEVSSLEEHTEVYA